MPGVRCEQGRFREDRSLSISSPDAQRITGLACELGFARAGFVNPRALVSPAGWLPSTSADKELEWKWVTSPNEWKGSASILVCCLSCHRGELDDLSTPDDPHGLIAPFARRNYYKTAARMMRRLLDRVEAELGIPRKSARIFCNSRMPEKPLCVAAELASPGRNGLCISPGLGSLFVIAGAVIPRPLADSVAPAPSGQSPCAGCRECVDACPAHAITSAGLVDRDLCLQGFATRPVEMPAEVMEKWGTRLYGCQECQSVCPYNRRLPVEGPPASGEIGPSVSLRWFLSLEDQQVETFLRGTAMGLSWISRVALTRNAIVAAGNSGAAVLRDRVAPYLDSGSPAISAAARWAMNRLPDPRAHQAADVLAPASGKERKDHEDRQEDEQQQIPDDGQP